LKPTSVLARTRRVDRARAVTEVRPLEATVRPSPLARFRARPLLSALLVTALGVVCGAPTRAHADDEKAGAGEPGGASAGEGTGGTGAGPEGESAEKSDLPRLLGPRGEDPTGKRIVATELVGEDTTFPIPPSVRVPDLGPFFSTSLARRAVHDLVETGLFASVAIETSPAGEGLRVRFVATSARVVSAVRIDNPTSLELSDVLRSAGLERGRTITAEELGRADHEVRDRLRRHGYPNARVQLSPRATDDARHVVVVVDVEPGRPRRLAGVRTDIEGLTLLDEVKPLADSHGTTAEEILDLDRLTERDERLAEKLRGRGYFRATITHRLYGDPEAPYVQILVTPGPKVKIVYEGNETVDKDRLDEIIDLEREPERTPARFVTKIKSEYVRMGFADAEVAATLRGTDQDPVHLVVLSIRERPRVRVVGRSFPCLSGPMTEKALNAELDAFLEEELPSPGLLSAVDPAAVDELLGPGNVTGARPAPFVLRPTTVLDEAVLGRALDHLKDLYQAEGYLSATVGPLRVLRRQCDPRSPAGQCQPLPAPPLPPAPCRLDAVGLPEEEPALPPEALCRPNPAKGITCEPTVRLSIPIKAGPQTRLWDVAFEGVTAFPEKALLAASTLQPGSPVSNDKIEGARRALRDVYRDKGYAFVEVEANLELSPDHQRGRVRFVVTERQPVTVAGITIRGNALTDEDVIRTRLRFHVGDLYRQADVRASEELLATLGTFSSVTIAFEDPGTPAKQKRVLVTVVERAAQYLEFRPGISTGEGVRALLEYGHYNLLGRAIQLTLRVQLNFLPTLFIPDERVRGNFEALPLSQRLERRNTAGIQFPNVFHPRVRFGFDLVEVRTNARDFGLTKQATIPVFSIRPTRRLTFTIGGSIERNDVRIFSGQAVEQYLQGANASNDLARLLRVPDGLTLVVAQRVSAGWDRRDNPLGATRGTLVVAAVEHVHAYPSADNPTQITSDFLRLSGTLGGYLRLSKKGLALAVNVRGGLIHQLIGGSRTYPDRLFFLGGVDTMRGFYRDSLVPQELARRIQNDANKPASDAGRFTIDNVAIRGGDVFVNPRIELRIPVSGPLETALFVDAGNVWIDPGEMRPWDLRYTSGTGLRVATPIGPVAVDYGINVTRRPWEDFGAFSFAVGLF
jgi:outer membrane protein insertion porin family